MSYLISKIIYQLQYRRLLVCVASTLTAPEREQLKTGVWLLIIRLGKLVLAIQVDKSAARLHAATFTAPKSVDDRIHEIS
jgi:hypothetical protein